MDFSLSVFTCAVSSLNLAIYCHDCITVHEKWPNTSYTNHSEPHWQGSKQYKANVLCEKTVYSVIVSLWRTWMVWLFNSFSIRWSVKYHFTVRLLTLVSCIFKSMLHNWHNPHYSSSSLSLCLYQSVDAHSSHFSAIWHVWNAIFLTEMMNWGIFYAPGAKRAFWKVRDKDADLD